MTGERKRDIIGQVTALLDVSIDGATVEAAPAQRHPLVSKKFFVVVLAVLACLTILFLTPTLLAYGIPQAIISRSLYIILGVALPYLGIQGSLDALSIFRKKG